MENKESRYGRVLECYNKDYSLSDIVDYTKLSFGEVKRIIKQIQDNNDGDNGIKEVDYVGR
jgi:hypothetical protein